MKLAFSSIAALTVAAAAALPTMAHAADGTITVTGAVGTQTCTIEGNGAGGGKDFTVQMPKVSTSALGVGGSTAGRTAFNIGLKNCAPASGKVYTHFEAGTTVNSTTGQLFNASGTAKNIEITLLNGSDYSQINLGKAQENSIPVDLANGSATLPYYAQYVAVGGGASAGTVNTSVMYSIMYQ
ncbi:MULTISPECIES: fimbrial protein [Burkholderia]|uniref:Fimbrial family protein n=1 Tax=Burkholderia cepacia TaxID=292 RepID=A0AA89CFW1_BURCE|nr:MULTISPECIES: fimbrial protein [Burkholderia]AOI79972.1 fimbrial protein [Burkholderia sp. NRF60-BP8]KGC08956.1 fimbrial family protein [Burkholderia cepacia]KVA13933.1 fimbrial protein [Burkholderia sp. NRF60-BP8]KVL16003.1 fimbrial protein [Burkholderia sp. MSMB1826]KWE63926.1 fimbrial protein [Burkholderia sp. MSMB2157WGS]